MNILVTGAKGMVGTALCNNLKALRDGKNRMRPNIHIEEIYEYDIDNTAEELDAFCAQADFVFNLAGVNRPTDPADFQKGNFGYACAIAAVFFVIVVTMSLVMKRVTSGNED